MLTCTQKDPAKIKLAKSPPTPLQALRMAQWNFLELLPESCLDSPVVSGNAGTKFHLVMHPPLIRDLLNARVKDFPKGNLIVDIFRSVAEHNIVSDHGKTWEKLRPPMAKAVHIRELKKFSGTISSIADAASARVSGLNGAPLDVDRLTIQSTFDIISKLALSEPDPKLMQTVHKALRTFTAEIARFSAFDFLDAPSWVPRPGRNTVSPSIAYGHKLVDSIIAQRKRKGANTPPDILDKLLEAQAKDPSISDAHIRDNLNVMLIAGHDTTARTISWALYLCAFDPRIQAAASREARAVLGGRAAGFNNIKQLPLTAQIIQETMRLYPSFPLLVRKSLITETMHGVDFRRDDQILIPLYALHRNKLYWDEPDSFRPARFNGETKIEKYAYLPFGGGSRVCIGASFAQVQAQILLATLLSRFHFSLIDGRNPRPSLGFSLTSKNGIFLNATPID